MTEKYVRNSEEKEFKKNMIFTGRLANFLLDELRKEKERNQRLIKENEILQETISVSRNCNLFIGDRHYWRSVSNPLRSHAP